MHRLTKESSHPVPSPHFRTLRKTNGGGTTTLRDQGDDSAPDRLGTLADSDTKSRRSTWLVLPTKAVTPRPPPPVPIPDKRSTGTNWEVEVRFDGSPRSHVTSSYGLRPWRYSIACPTGRNHWFDFRRRP